MGHKKGFLKKKKGQRSTPGGRKCNLAHHFRCVVYSLIPVKTGEISGGERKKKRPSVVLLSSNSALTDFTGSQNKKEAAAIVHFSHRKYIPVACFFSPGFSNSQPDWIKLGQAAMWKLSSYIKIITFIFPSFNTNIDFLIFHLIIYPSFQ